MKTFGPPSSSWPRSAYSVAAIVALFALALTWAYWTTLQDLEHRWSSDPQTSHGFVVPALAILVLWFRRSSIAFGGGTSWGLALLALGGLCRLMEAKFFLPWFGPFSLIPTLGGVVLLAGGWPLLRWSWPGLALLVFMLPLPYTLEVGLAGPLQQMATAAATYTLQALGIPAFAQGNVIQINELQIGVVEACNGLGMLVAFFAVSTAMAFVINRPWPDRAIIFFSAIPIALVMNWLRITATALAHVLFGSKVADGVFHDVAGWLMPPLAIVPLWLELKLYDRLFVPEPVRKETEIAPVDSRVELEEAVPEPSMNEAIRTL